MKCRSSSILNLHSPSGLFIPHIQPVSFLTSTVTPGSRVQWRWARWRWDTLSNGLDMFILSHTHMHSFIHSQPCPYAFIHLFILSHAHMHSFIHPQGCPHACMHSFIHPQPRPMHLFIYPFSFFVKYQIKAAEDTPQSSDQRVHGFFARFN